jgi:hypothetical protein
MEEPTAKDNRTDIITSTSLPSAQIICTIFMPQRHCHANKSKTRDTQAKTF